MEAAAIWSQWDGYLKQPDGSGIARFIGGTRHFADPSPIPPAMPASSTSNGFAEAIAPKMLVPIHTFEANQFPQHFANVAIKQDGVWWEVPA